MRLLPVWFTIEDLFDFTVSSIIFLFTLNAVIESCHGKEVCNIESQCVYLWGILYLAFRLVQWVYVNNSNSWYWMERSYTNYYDREGKRIAKDDIVIYYGKRYHLYFSGDVIGRKDNEKKEEWRLISTEAGMLQEYISLEEAVKDQDGNLVIEKWQLGEKIST